MEEKEGNLKVIVRRAIILKKFLTSGLKLTALKPYWHNSVIAQVLFVSALINASMWAYLLASHENMGDSIILHYNLFFGVDPRGDYSKVFYLPATGLIFLILNSTLGNYFYRIERLASYLLTLNTLLIQILLMLASYLIIRVNS